MAIANRLDRCDQDAIAAKMQAVANQGKKQ